MGQAYLAAMRVSAQQQPEAGKSSPVKDFRRVRKQNRELVPGNLRSCFLDVIRPVVVSIVNAGQIDALIAALD